MGGSSKFIHLDLAHFKLQIRMTHEAELTLYFDSPSRRFYLSVIGLVIYQMKQAGRFTSVPLSVHRDSLVLLNETVGGAAGSAAGLIPRIYRKWKTVLPDLESAPLFKVVGRKREQDETGRVYRVSDGERDAWANLFEYKGSEQNVRLRFSADRLGIGLDDITITYNDHLNIEGWELFVADLANSRAPVPESPVSPSPPTVGAPNHSLYQRVFVGRQSELAQLQSAFDGAISGEGGLVMIVGEPGIGKTALWEQLSRYVATRGGITLVGHSYEEGSLSLPYLPFVEALRTYVHMCPPDDLKTRLGQAAPYIARIVPEVRDETAASPKTTDPQEQLYLLLQGVTDFLGAIARTTPLLLVAEDLHNADRGTLDMLRYLGRFLADKHLLIIGTYRDMEVDRTHPLSSTLAELKRLPTYSRLLLRGLAVDEVRQMCSSIASQEVHHRLGETVHRQTEGNPLFVQEVVHYFLELGITSNTDIELRMPDGLKDVVGKRLSSLSTVCNKLLSQAAVVGHDFRLDVLEQVSDLSEDDFFSVLEEAMKAAIIEEHAALGGEITYSFVHAFFRQTLYEEIIAPRRIRLHQQVAKALEHIHSSRLDEHASELADHYAHSSDPVDLQKAVTYGERAAARAASVFAFSEAARLLDQALKVQEIVDPDDRVKKCDLLIDLSRTLIEAFELRKALDTCVPEAFSVAESIDDKRRMSAACQLALIGLSFWANFNISGWGSSETAQWIARANKYVVPNTPSQVWADVANGCFNCYKGGFAGELEVMAIGVGLCRRALEMARSLEDKEALYWASFWWLTFAKAPHHFDERLRLAEELIKGDLSAMLVKGLLAGQTVALDVLLEWGMRVKVEEGVQQRKSIDSHSGQSRLHLKLWDALFATLDGRLQEAVQISDEIRDQGKDLGVPEYGAVIAGLCGVTPRLLLGRYEEAFNIAAAHKESLFARAGNLAEARKALQKWVIERPNFGTDQDEIGATKDVCLLEESVIVEHMAASELLMKRLHKVANHAVAVNRLTCIGRHLGSAAAMLGRPDEARGYYDQAMEVARKLRFRPEIALIRLQQAELILNHYPAERATAGEYLDFAIVEFREMKMQPSLERALSREEILKA